MHYLAGILVYLFVAGPGGILFSQAPEFPDQKQRAKSGIKRISGYVDEGQQPSPGRLYFTAEYDRKGDLIEKKYYRNDGRFRAIEQFFFYRKTETVPVADLRKIKKIPYCSLHFLERSTRVDSIVYYQHGIPYKLQLIFYTPEGQILRDEIQQPPGTLFSLDQRVYDAKGNWIRTSSFEGPKKKITQTEFRQYNQQGQLENLLTLVPARKLGPEDENRIARLTLTKAQMPDRRSRLKFEYSFGYDSLGRCIRQQEIFHGQNASDTMHTSFFYSPTGFYTKKEVHDRHHNMGDYYKIERDLQGRVLRQKIFRGDQQLEIRSFTYDQNGNTIREELESIRNGPFRQYARVYGYDRQSKLSSIQLLTNREKPPNSPWLPENRGNAPAWDTLALQVFWPEPGEAIAYHVRKYRVSHFSSGDNFFPKLTSNPKIEQSCWPCIFWLKNLSTPADRRANRTRDLVEIRKTGINAHSIQLERLIQWKPDEKMQFMHFLDQNGQVIYGIDRDSASLTIRSRVLRLRWADGQQSSYRTTMKYFEFPMDSTFFNEKGRIKKRINYAHGIHAPFQNVALLEQMPYKETFFPTVEIPIYDSLGRHFQTHYLRANSAYIHKYSFPQGQEEKVQTYDVREGVSQHYRYEFYRSGQD